MIIESIDEFKNISRRWENMICFVSGFFAGGLSGFNGFMWSQAVIVDKHTLSIASLLGVVICLLRWVYAPHQHRYLYAAFFMYGICFNNHQSLLPIVMGMQVLVWMAEPKLGREFFFGNTLIYIAVGFLIEPSILVHNTTVFVIYNIIGIASAVLWIWLLIKTKKTAIEFGRDAAMLAFLGCLRSLFGLHYALHSRFQQHIQSLFGFYRDNCSWRHFYSSRQKNQSFFQGMVRRSGMRCGLVAGRGILFL